MPPICQATMIRCLSLKYLAQSSALLFNLEIDPAFECTNSRFVNSLCMPEEQVWPLGQPGGCKKEKKLQAQTAC